MSNFYLQAAGHRLYAQAIGSWTPSDRQSTLVFLHEGLGSIPQWKDFPAQLCAATGLPGLVYERWGFGHSDPLDKPRTPFYLHQEALESLPDVLRTCGIAHPILLGHSDGGSIALIFAAAYPHWPRAIITEAAHVFVEEITLAGIRVAGEWYETSDWPQRLARYHGDHTDAMFHGWCDTWQLPEFRDWNIETELSGIVCPALIMQGQQDEYATIGQVDVIAAGVSGPVTTCLIPDCGHTPHHQSRERVLSEMVGFINKASVRRVSLGG